MALHAFLRKDPVLRIGGLALLYLAAGIGSDLFGAGPRGAGAIDYLLALAGFLAASIGAALAWQGRHLFDQVNLSSRCTSHIVERAGPDRAGALMLNNPAKRSAASS